MKKGKSRTGITRSGAKVGKNSNVSSDGLYLSVEEAFSKAFSCKQLIDLDKHLEGVLFQLQEGAFTPSNDNLRGSRLFVEQRALKTITRLGQPQAVRSEMRQKLKKRTLAFQQDVLNHPKFQWCFRNYLSKNTYYSHFDRIASEHALYLAYAVYLTSGLFQITLKHSHRQGKYYTQTEVCPLTVLFLYYSKQLRSCKSEKEIVKKIKISLCTEFSRQSEQDIPDGHEIAFRVFPESMRNYLEKKLNSDRKGRIQFYFSILQSKSLCKEVSDDMVQESLEKHRSTLGERETRKLEPQFKEILIEQGNSLGKYLRDHYNPSKTVKAPTSASFNNPRKSGGVLGELAEKSIISTSSGITEYNGDDRMEPLVVGLFALPAAGKTTLVQEIISQAHRELFPEWNLNEISYSRSCSSKHWDGYTGQPIVVLDDMGQSADRHDVEEFQQLISCNTYQLPMADLQSKGMKFSSPLVIVTSNMSFGQDLTVNQQIPIEDNLAFWRRFHVPFVLDKKGDSIIYTDRLTSYFSTEEKKQFKPHQSCNGSLGFENLIFPCYFDQSVVDLTSSTYTSSRSRNLPRCGRLNFSFKRVERKSLIPIIWNTFRASVDFFHSKTSKYWTQIVGSECLQAFETEEGLKMIREIPRSGASQTVRYSFPRLPPKELLPVRVEPIKEPLKVRIITAGLAETRCLKPLQQAMHAYLGTQKQFCLTHGTKFLEKAMLNCTENSKRDPKIDEILDRLDSLEGRDLVYCSGDYESATDNFILECGSVILKQALQFVDHEPTREWAMKEVSSHILHYPRESQLKPIVQTNGQLMGSLLSFPLLCLVNDATAKLAGASQDHYLINGDDIVLRVERQVANKWRKIAPGLGLTLSLGKTFFDSDFGTVNSQLFYEGKLVQTGKLKLTSRRTEILGECYRDLQRLFLTEENSEYLRETFLKINRPALKGTFESLDIPTSHGGLGLVSSGHEPNKKQKENDFFVYISKLRKKLSACKGHLKLPFFGVEDGQRDPFFSSLLEIPSEKVASNGVTGKDMFKTRKSVFKHPSLRLLLDEVKDCGTDLVSLPDLGFIQVRSVLYSGSDYKEKQEAISNRFFNFFNPSVLLSQENKNLVQLYRVIQKNREIEGLGLLREKLDIPFHEYFSDSVLPEPLVCEKLWSKLFQGLVETELDLNHEIELVSGVKTSRKVDRDYEIKFNPIDFTQEDMGWDKPSYSLDDKSLELFEEPELLPEEPIEMCS